MKRLLFILGLLLPVWPAQAGLPIFSVLAGGGLVNGSVASTPWVTNFPSSSPRSGSFWVGCRITVGASPVSVTSLGRAMISGNNQAHTIRAYKVSDNSVAVSVSINMSGQTVGQYAYASTSGTLAASTQYYLVSDETANVDTWYDEFSSFTTTAVAVMDGTVYSSDAISWGFAPAAGHAFVGVNFQY